MNTLLRIILCPFSLIYGLITALRNHLFDIGYKKSFRFDTPVIGVGNLSVGGNGKTPMVEYLLVLLKQKYQVATLSRGYGRNTKGFRLATSAENAGTLGDEPYQIFTKFHKQVTVAVGEERALAIPVILQERPETEVIVLDDAFQHRSVRPHLNILVTDFSRPFFRDYILPAGRLREYRKGASRAQLIVVTKCPQQLDPTTQNQYLQRIARYAPQAKIYFSSMEVQPIQPLFDQTTTPRTTGGLILVSGIANPTSLELLVPDHQKIIKHLRYADHHRYRLADIEKIRMEFSAHTDADAIILTTEKDRVKLQEFREHLIDLPIYYLPIRVRLLNGSESFDQEILNNLESVDSEL